MKEIERRFLIVDLPFDINRFERLEILQGYIFFRPAVRIRRQNDSYFLTIKSKSLLIRDELEMSISEEDFNSMWRKIEGTPVEKCRYKIPLEHGLTAELDIFCGGLAPLKIIEVEFKSIEEAENFDPPDWFGEEITYRPEYANSNLSENGLPM